MLIDFVEPIEAEATRKLQSSLSCPTLDCFNCAYTKGSCYFDSAGNKCVDPRQASSSLNIISTSQSWYTYFQSCNDRLDLCASNTAGLTQLSGSVKDSLANGSVAFFTMSADLNFSNTNTIQRNYFCNWQLDLDYSATYLIEIERNFIDAEEIELVAQSSDKYYSYSDEQLKDDNSNIEQ